MKIVSYNGSPKGKKSVTHIMVEEVLKGAKEAGAEVLNYTLAEKNINHCKGCFHCWYVDKNKCVIKDDMEEALSHFADLDILLLATPLHFDNVSGMMKVFLDRCTAFGSYYIEKDENGESKHVDSYKNMDNYKETPKIVLLSNAGFPEPSQFQALDFMIERMARNMSTEVIAKIFRGQGPLLGLENEQLKPIVDNYKSLLRQAGREIAKNMKIDEGTKAQLEQPLIPFDIYLKQINQRNK